MYASIFVVFVLFALGKTIYWILYPPPPTAGRGTRPVYRGRVDRRQRRQRDDYNIL